MEAVCQLSARIPICLSDLPRHKWSKICPGWSCLTEMLGGAYMPNLVLLNSDDWLGGCWCRGEREWLLGTAMAQPIPELWDREREWKSYSQDLGTGMIKCIPKFGERELEWKNHTHFSGTGMEGRYSREWLGPGTPAHPCAGVSQQKHMSLSNQGECNMICVYSALNLIQIKHKSIRVYCTQVNLCLSSWDLETVPCLLLSQQATAQRDLGMHQTNCANCSSSLICMCCVIASSCVSCSQW